MPPLTMSDREKKLAMATAMVFLFYVFYQFLLTPEWNGMIKMQKKLQDARLELKIAEGKIDLLEKLQKQQPAQAGIVGVSKEERPLAVLRALAQATSRSRLNLISVKPIMVEGKKDEFKFDVVCTGNYQNLYEFLRILHGLDIIVMVDSLRISGGGSRRPDLHMKILLTAYF